MTSKKNNSIRLNKYISNSGVCSRREADVHISLGMVKVNGKVITEMGFKVDPSDEIHYDGRKLSSDKPTYILLNKPKGYIASIKKGTYKKDVLELIKDNLSNRIEPIHSMSRTSSGLLLFTNDLELKNKLRYAPRIKKIFQVILNKNISPADINTLKQGILIEPKIEIKAEEATYIQGENKQKVGVELHSERHRAVFQIFEKLDYVVEQVDHITYAHLTKKNLPRGRWRHLTPQEINLFKMLK